MSFDHIPQLQELLNAHGTPGLTYAQVCVHNATRAQEDGYRQTPSVPFYTITGPKGTVTMVLLVKGRPIPGAQPGSSRPLVLADPDILKLTGLNPNPDRLDEGVTSAQVSTPTPRRKGAVQSPQGDGGVQAGNTP